MERVDYSSYFFIIFFLLYIYKLFSFTLHPLIGLVPGLGWLHLAEWNDQHSQVASAYKE